MCTNLWRYLSLGRTKCYCSTQLFLPCNILSAVYKNLLTRNATNLTTTTTKHTEGGTLTSNENIEPIKMAYNSYESTNPSLASSDPPIIIMHGILGSKNNWNSLSKFIHNKCRRKIFSVDARNHGDSPHTPEMSYDHLAHDVLKFMHDLDLKEATFLGHSMGGRAMMCFALHFPEYVEKLIVVDISPIGSSPSMNFLPLILDAISQVQLDKDSARSWGSARRDADRQMAMNISDVRTRQFILTNLVKDEQGGYKWRMNVESLINNYPKLHTFETSDTCERPTYFVGGGSSDFIPHEDHEEIRKIFPDVKFDYVAGAGHLVHLEQPLKFIDLVCNFVGNKT